MTLKLVILFCLTSLTCAHHHLRYVYYPYYYGTNYQYPHYDGYKINRIIGGENARKGEFPHQVSLQLGYPPFTPYTHMCGGSIISDRWILTAAHCVNNLGQYGSLVVKAGKYFIKHREISEQVVSVLRIIVHEKYLGAVSPFDIALLELTNPLQFNRYVSPINLPTPNVLPQGVATLSGWGSTSRTSVPVLPSVLQKVDLPIIDLNTCRIAMRQLGQPGEVDDTNLCTGPLTGGTSACSGDSGGPLIQVNQYGVREIVGIVSWGVIPCAGPGAPAVFVRVSAFVDWVNAAMNNYYY